MTGTDVVFSGARMRLRMAYKTLEVARRTKVGMKRAAVSVVMAENALRRLYIATGVYDTAMYTAGSKQQGW